MRDELPEGWVHGPLGELAKPIRPRRNPQEYPKLPFVGMEQVESHTRRLLGTQPARVMKSSAFHFQPGDVLYGRLRPYLNKVLCAEFEGLCSSEFIVLPTNGVAEPKFLAFHLSTNGFVAFANLLNQGDRPRVRFDQIAEYQIAIPPLPEQRRIVASLEKLLGKVDACQKRLAKIPVLLKRFRQSVLAAACSGRLTADWREQQPIPESGDNDRDLKLPGSWKSIEFGQLISDGPQNGLYKPSTFYGDGTLIVRIDAFYDGTIAEWSELKRLRLTEKERAQFALRNGDILINRVNSPMFLGKAALVRGLSEPCVYESNMMRLRLDRSQVQPDYAIIYLQSLPGLVELRMNAKHAINQSSINQEDVKAALFNLPPLAEQQEIFRRVEALFALADQIEARFVKAKAHVDKLTPSLLAKAFRGELVPTEAELARREGRDYEPAAKLLERIRGDREPLSGGTGRRRTIKKV